ncbi:hypothetical protein PINS_up020359 [Pythium insidiosum]|nr:hypothetical protein PINS_up020359 [Pythium insidiosum]
MADPVVQQHEELLRLPMETMLVPSAISVAVSEGSADALECLLSSAWTQRLLRSRDATIHGVSLARLLCTAVRCGHVECVRVLLAHGASPLATGVRHEPPLVVACHGADGIELVDMLLAHGASLGLLPHQHQHEADEEHAMTTAAATLVAAIEAGSVAKVARLLASGCDPNATSSSAHPSPLESAVRECNATVVQLLLNAGANTDMNTNATPSDWSLLTTAIQCGHATGCDGYRDVVHALLAFGCDPNAELRHRNHDFEHSLPLRYEPLVGTALFDHLLESGEFPFASDLVVARSTVLLVEIRTAPLSSVGAVPSLLEFGADIEWRGPLGWRALHVAATRRHVEFVRLLLMHSADANARDDSGETPLLHAIAPSRDIHGAVVDGLTLAQAQLETVRLLLRAGANVEGVTTYRGRTPLQEAEHHGLHEIVQLLRQSVA